MLCNGYGKETGEIDSKAFFALDYSDEDVQSQCCENHSTIQSCTSIMYLCVFEWLEREGMDNQLTVEQKLTIEKKYLLVLLRCALRPEPTPIPPVILDWHKLVTLAQRQSVVALVQKTLSGVSIPNKQVAFVLNQSVAKAQAKEARQQIEAEIVMVGLEKLGIKHLPLKGFIIKNLYPSPNMRSSSDVDILYDQAQYQAMKSVMRSCGFVEKEHPSNGGLMFITKSLQ